MSTNPTTGRRSWKHGDYCQAFRICDGLDKPISKPHSDWSSLLNELLLELKLSTAGDRLAFVKENSPFSDPDRLVFKQDYIDFLNCTGDWVITVKGVPTFVLRHWKEL